MMGMPKRDSSIAFFCILLRNSGFISKYIKEPISDGTFFTSSPTLFTLLFRPNVYWFSCKIFSSNVIRDIKSSIRFSIGALASLYKGILFLSFDERECVTPNRHNPKIKTFFLICFFVG